jgi:hypothetical protein
VFLLATSVSQLFAQSQLPGTIQAEDFDQGAAGVAYSDTTPGNKGGVYRATDVDIEPTTDTGGGYNIGWVHATEWLKYTVNVGAAGVYDVDVRVASGGVGGTFHIEVNGVDKTGPLVVPNTGGWQTWTTIRKTGVSLAAGSQVLRLVMDTEGPTTATGNVNWIRVAASGGGGTPYGGTAVALPGTIQAENFNEGAAGVAYSDTTAGNAGGQYRSTDVDIEASGDTAGGYDIGWVSAKEWLNYTVNVGAAGSYDLDVRVASAGVGGTFHVEVNGVDKTGPLNVPNTGGWQTWTTIRRTGVSLSAGSQVWRVVMDTNGATGFVGNFNYFRLNAAAAAGSTPYGGTPTALPGTLQLENFDDGGPGVAYADTTTTNSGGQYRQTGVDIEKTSDLSGGYDLSWVFAGEWLNYTVNVGTAGTYDLDVRVASGGAGGTFHVEVNGVDKTGPLVVPNTGGWQTWTTIRKTGVSVGAGAQVWRLVMDANGATTAVGNFNWIRLSSTNKPPTVALTSPAAGATFTAPATVTMNATAADTDGTIARVDFFAGGTLVGSDATAPYSATWSAAAAGTFSLTAVAVDNSGASTTSGAVGVQVNGSANKPPTATLTAPAGGAAYTAPATIAMTATASDPDGTVARVEFYSGTTLLGTDTTAPYSYSWASVPAGTYVLKAVAYDAAGASGSSATATVTVSTVTVSPPTAVIFQASADHATLVTSYRLEVFASGADPNTATPIATSDLGKPAPDANNDITVNRATFFSNLAVGSYIATVSAAGTTGSARSTPPTAFTR